MDITEAFRQEDIVKTDFFDFVVSPEVSDATAFHRSMKSVNVYLESYNNNNNEDPSTDRKEANNNHLVLGNGVPEGSESSPGHGFTEPPFWVDKDGAHRWEPAMLEAIGCWSQAHGAGGAGSPTSGAKTDGNTDGAIYTLTVLNGAEPPEATWYRPPDPTEEESKTSHGSVPSHHNSIDLETFLDSIPPVSKSVSVTEPTFRNGNSYPRTSEMSTTTADVVKTEFAFDDSGYAEKEEVKMGHLVTDVGSTASATGFNNNNDWKMSDNNEKPLGGMDSLLRNALQGKAFLTRYNGAPVVKTEKEDIGRVMGSPPAKPASEASYTAELEEDKTGTGSPMVTVSVDAGTGAHTHTHTHVVMYDGSGTAMLIDSDNPSAQSMDDLFLSQLDAASYPEDYEKLKRIENEVAESVEQYCNLDPTGQHHIYIPTHLGGPESGRLQQIGGLDHILSIHSPTTTSKPSAKKYSKRSPSAAKSGQGMQSPSSTGVRKERSLHYCNICSKGFKDKYSVNVHIRTHTGEKPFNCSLCGKSFRQKAHLAKHYHTHLAQAKNAAAASKPAPGKSGQTVPR